MFIIKKKTCGDGLRRLWISQRGTKEYLRYLLVSQGPWGQMQKRPLPPWGFCTHISSATSRCHCTIWVRNEIFWKWGRASQAQSAKSQVTGSARGQPRWAFLAPAQQQVVRADLPDSRLTLPCFRDPCKEPSPPEGGLPVFWEPRRAARVPEPRSWTGKVCMTQLVTTVSGGHMRSLAFIT